METIIFGLICLGYSGATNSMIKRLHNNAYERKVCYNKVEYSTL